MIFNILCIVAMFCYAWLGQSFIRFYKQDSIAMFLVSKSLLTKSLVIGAIVFVIACKVFTNTPILQILYFVPTFFLFGYYCFFLLVSQAKQNAKLVMFCEVLRTFLNISLLFILNKFLGRSESIFFLATALFISYVVPTLILVKKLSYNKVELSKTEAVSIKKIVFEYGIPIAFFLSASLALSVNDRYIISFLLGKQKAGIYSAIYDVINKGVTALFSPILMTFYPIIATLYNTGDRIGAIKKLKKIFFLEIGLMLFGLLILVFGAGFILNIIFGCIMPQELNKVVCLIYVGVCLWQISMLVHKPLELLQRTKLMAVAVFISLLLNIFLNFFLLHQFESFIVCAITTIISSLMYLTIIMYLNFKFKFF
jgi:O-antigen/teichoic acid export membrane protein